MFIARDRESLRTPLGVPCPAHPRSLLTHYAWLCRTVGWATIALDRQVIQYVRRVDKATPLNQSILDKISS